MTRIAIVLAWLALASAVDARAEAPACEVEVVVEPTRPIVGQQILYRARIFRREDVDRVVWVQPPAFPNLRAEWLPGRAEDTRAERHGASYRVREDQRALFAAWPGRLTLPEFEIACDEEPARVPSATLDVRAPPERGRTSDFSGVVGPLQVQTTADQDEIALGSSLRVSVLVRGDSNLWDLPTPFAGLDSASARVYGHEPQLDLEAGERLYVRRYFRFDFVPREEGRFEIPAVRVPYFDARRQRYAFATTAPIEIRVGPRRAGTNVPDADAPPGTPDASPRSGASVALLLALALVTAAAVARWRAGRSRRGVRSEIEISLTEATRLRTAGNATEEAAALVHALTLAASLAHRSDSEEADVERHRAALEAIRFAPDASAPDHEAVVSLIERLTRRLR